MLSCPDQPLNGGSGTDFFDVAHRLFHQSGDAAGLIAGGGVHLLNGLAVGLHILGPQFVAHLDDLQTHLGRDGTLGQNVLAPGKPGTSPMMTLPPSSHHQVGHLPDGDIAGEGRGPVGAATLHSQHQLGERKFFHGQGAAAA